MTDSISKKRSLEWRKNNKKRVKEYSIKKNLMDSFGMTLSEYDELLKKQHYVCAICKNPERVKEARTGVVRRLAVDHCHKTNKVRGLLCSTCNIAIGLMKDDLNLILNIIAYLKS